MASFPLTVEQLRSIVTTTLADDGLQILLDAAEAAILAVAGGAGEVTEYIEDEPGYPTLVLARLPGEVSAVTEGGVLLDPSAYRVSGYVLARLDANGAPYRWGRSTSVTYTPADDGAERSRVQAELVKLDLTFSPGLTAQSIGSWSESYLQGGEAYAGERAAILATLGRADGMAVVD